MYATKLLHSQEENTGKKLQDIGSGTEFLGYGTKSTGNKMKEENETTSNLTFVFQRKQQGKGNLWTLQITYMMKD